MPITKPPGIKSDAFKSAKRDELTQGREFAQSDARALACLQLGTPLISTRSNQHHTGCLRLYKNDDML